MLINTVILMLRDALPIALLMSFLLLAFRLQRKTLVVLLLSTAITTALLVLLRNSVSDTFDGAGYEWLTVALLLIAYLFALLSLDFRAYRSSAIIAAVPVISLHLADFMLYLFALFARLRVLERRLGNVASSRIQLHGVELDLAEHSVTVNDAPVALPRREFMVLRILMENAGRVLSKQQFENKLYEWGDEVASNTVEVHISNLRKKLPEQFIKTIRGVGYTTPKGP